MYITFTGAARCVTGSCTLIETDDKKVLVDCGMRQGADAKNTPVKDGFVFDAGQIDAVFLTHAHIDHSGLIPLLVKKGFTGQVFCTGATSRLCSIMFPDAGHIQEMETEWANRKRRRAGKKEIEPLYTVEDAKRAITHLVPMDYDETSKVLGDISVRFVDAGHLLGSASIELCVEDKKLVFSGDIGNKDKPIIKDPIYIKDADMVFMESTYGDRNHKDLLPTSEQLRIALTAALKRGGNIVIPSFAVGRTQEVLYAISIMLEENSIPGLEKVPVYIDSPLGIAATEIFKTSSKGYFDKEAMAFKSEGVEFFSFKTLIVAQSVDESKAINMDKRQKIIISSSGMCTAGRIKHHLKHNIWKTNATVLFVGYQANGTLGRRILDGADNIRIFGEEIQPRATIERIEGFSGHADKDGLLEWIGHFPTSVRKVFVMHGENSVSINFAKDLEGLGYDAVSPELLDTFDTSKMMSERKKVKYVKAEPSDIMDELSQKLGEVSNDEKLRMKKELENLLKKWDKE
ncbi:MAG: MBL fold metallo-hydrolase [Clostridia bacterium]|jgi:metallo-beta-lactamase family protein|nr:MBL fold metallo-hydrolase [Clostridia bacterium]MBT7122329.1 MBL fold metallo-hydrolase [Clostridia bacterium]